MPTRRATKSAAAKRLAIPKVSGAMLRALTAPAAKAKLQTTFVAVRDSLADVGHAWIDNRGTVYKRGIYRMTIRLEPVWAPLTTSGLVLALAKQNFRPRTVRPGPGIDLRVVHTPTGVEVDFALAAKLSARTSKYLDELLGRGWLAKGPPKKM